MSLRCFLGLHRPTMASIVRKGDRLHAICEACARPLIKVPPGNWRPTEPLDRPRQPFQDLGAR